jgi:hypothetical protein
MHVARIGPDYDKVSCIPGIQKITNSICIIPKGGSCIYFSIGPFSKASCDYLDTEKRMVRIRRRH